MLSASQLLKVTEDLVDRVDRCRDDRKELRDELAAQQKVSGRAVMGVRPWQHRLPERLVRGLYVRQGAWYPGRRALILRRRHRIHAGPGVPEPTFSFDDFIIAFFVAGTKPTLPIYVFSSIRRGVTPEINAVATIVLCVSLAAVFSAQALLGRQKGKSSRN